MITDKINFDDESFVASEDKFLKKHNNIYISDEQISILKKYNLDINNYSNVKDLIFDIENILNDSFESLDDLEWVSATLSDYNYYYNVNK